MRASVVVVACLSSIAFASMSAQVQSGEPGKFATRTALLRQAEIASESAASVGVSREVRDRNLREADAIRSRLATGDFAPGDRIVLVVKSDPTLSDTLVVKADTTVEPRGLPRIPVTGVLYSEISAHLTTALAKYLVDPRVTATPLIRLGVLGSVMRSGWSYVRTDLLVSDVIMLFGGPTNDADLSNVRVWREGTERLKKEDLRRALAQGETLDQLGIRSGDEIRVEAKKNINYSTAIQAASILLGIAVTIVGFSRK